MKILNWLILILFIAVVLLGGQFLYSKFREDFNAYQSTESENNSEVATSESSRQMGPPTSVIIGEDASPSQPTDEGSLGSIEEQEQKQSLAPPPVIIEEEGEGPRGVLPDGTPVLLIPDEPAQAPSEEDITQLSIENDSLIPSSITVNKGEGIQLRVEARDSDYSIGIPSFVEDEMIAEGGNQYIAFVISLEFEEESVPIVIKRNDSIVFEGSMNVNQ